MLIYFSEEIILPWAGHYPKFRKKNVLKNCMRKIQPLKLTFYYDNRHISGFPSLLFCSLARKDNIIKHSETRLLLLLISIQMFSKHSQEKS